MDIIKDKIIIELTGEEINTFWNIIAFSLDYNAEHPNSLTEDELDMAKKLCAATDKYN